MIHNWLKFTSQLISPCGWMVRSLCWCLSQPGFDPSYCLATLMSSDRTKQICLWMTIYIYIYIYISFSIGSIKSEDLPAWHHCHHFYFLYMSGGSSSYISIEYLLLSHTLSNLDLKEFNEGVFTSADGSLFQESTTLLLKNICLLIILQYLFKNLVHVH